MQSQKLTLLSEAEAQALVKKHKKYYRNNQKQHNINPEIIAKKLNKVADLCAQNIQLLASHIEDEVYKTSEEALFEVDNAIKLIRLTAHEVMSIQTEYYTLPDGKEAYTIQQSTGLVLAISPYNFPLYTLCHKVLPAMAMQNNVIMKPSPHAPNIAYAFYQLLLEAGFDTDVIGFLHCENNIMENIISMPEIDFVNFTGSCEVGWNIRSKAAPGTRLLLELGGNAPVIVDNTVEDIDAIVQACLMGGYFFGGQVCISVQRIIVHEDIYNEFSTKLLHGMQAVEPHKLISEQHCTNILKKINNILDNSECQLLTGGQQINAQTMQPTILEILDNTNQQANSIMQDELFGPVVFLEKYTDLDDAIISANNTKYGLAAGFFTNNLKTARILTEQLDFGTVTQNNIPTFRSNYIPVGAVKQSGLAQESPKWAMKEMSNNKTIIINKL